MACAAVQDLSQNPGSLDKLSELEGTTLEASYVPVPVYTV